MTSGPVTPNQRGLGASARASLLWGGGFTLLRDVAQFGVMLILVRLLTPADYGTAALAQAIVGVVSVLSFGTFSGYALQIRNPDHIDWQAYFTLAAVQNTILAGLVLLLAFGLSFSQHYREAALPLAALTVGFLIEIPGTLRHRMLEVQHDWKRFRLLLILGTFLGLGTGILVALMGGGVWALIVQVPMLGVPAAIDLLIFQRFRPDWSWSRARWYEAFCFGLNRIGSGLVGRGRALNEQVLLSGVYDLATLGIFSRANGLATLIAGRFGSVVILSLYPVITRADSGSARFQGLTDLVLRGVVWTTLPSAAFLAIAAQDTVTLLYGSQWTGVALLLPLAACAVGFGGIFTAMSSLLMANNDTRAALWLDFLAGVSGIAVAVTLIPFGARTYLAGLSVHALLIVIAAAVLLVRRGAMSSAGVVAAFVPAVVAAAAGVVAVETWRATSGGSGWLLLRLLADGTIFAAINLLVLRVAFANALAGLVIVTPGRAWVRKKLRLVP